MWDFRLGRDSNQYLSWSDLSKLVQDVVVGIDASLSTRRDPQTSAPIWQRQHFVPTAPVMQTAPHLQNSKARPPDSILWAIPRDAKRALPDVFTTAERLRLSTRFATTVLPILPHLPHCPLTQMEQICREIGLHAVLRVSRLPLRSR